MNKKKWFSVVSTGILAFSSGAPSVLAGAPFVLDLLQDEDDLQLDLDSAVTLADLVEVSDESIQALLSDIRVSKDSVGNIVLVGNSSTYALDISINEESVSIEENDEFSVTLTLNQEINDEKLSIRLSSAGETVEEISIPVEELAILADFSDTYNEDVPALEEEETAEEKQEDLEEIIEDTETIEEQDSVVEDVEDTEPVVEEIEEEETETEEVAAEENTTSEEVEEELVETDNEREPVDAITETELEEVDQEDISESEEDVVSFERAPEVESLLHGEQEVEPVFELFSMRTFSTASARTHSDGLYTIRSGDTFGAIATSFNLSQAQLREWNRHVSNTSSLSVGTRLAVTRRGVERLLSTADQNRLYKGGATPVFSTNQGFINEIAPRAIAVANQKGEERLYASLMIAQAAHESAYGRSSLASPPYYNLSGIKGTHNGNSTLMWTWEVYNGVRVDVLAGFRQYPSYDASLQDYANLLRRGLSWDRRYYAGTWRSNTTSVFDVLDNGGLRGYATDPNYFAAIRRIITQFNLTQYDSASASQPTVVENVSGSRAVSYEGVLRSGYTIDSLPWGMNGFTRLNSTSNFNGRTVEVTRESQDGNYILIKLGNDVLGWVDARALATLSVSRLSNGNSANYHTSINGNSYPLLTLPTGLNGSHKIANASSYTGQELKVVQESLDRNFVLLERNGQLIGWVNKNALRTPVAQPASTSSTNYKATVVASGYSIDTLPWGRSGFQRITRTNHFVGQEATILRETTNGNYVLLQVNGRTLGWTDRRAVKRPVQAQNVSSSWRVEYTAKIQNGGYSIDSLPWGTNGFERIDSSTNLRGRTVQVTHHAGRYVRISMNNNDIGWVDAQALDYVPRVQTNVSGQSVNYRANLKNGYSIDTLPWGTRGFERISRTTLQNGRNIRAIRHSGSYVLIENNGVPIGWVDVKALQR